MEESPIIKCHKALLNIDFLDIELIRNFESRHTPAISNLSVSQLAIVLNEVATHVLFGEIKISVFKTSPLMVKSPTTADTLVLDGPCVDIYKVEVHISPLAVLLVPTSPLFKDSTDLEAPTDASNMPCAFYQNSCKNTILEDSVFSNVSFGKLGLFCTVNESPDNEHSNEVLVFAHDLSSNTTLKELEDHAVLFPILEIVTDPDSISQVLGIKEALRVTGILN